MANVFFYNSPAGPVGVAEEDGAIAHVFFSGRKKTLQGYVLGETPLIKKAGAQLAEYFAGKRKYFDLPLSPRGTAFQLSVWKVLQKIPYGETRSYRDIARLTGNPKACRAVGGANNRNPIGIIIPCHRVIGADGSLVGYASGLAHKRYLLDLERSKEKDHG